MRKGMMQRDFSLVVIGQVISIFGSAILRFALNLYILDITERADIFGLLLAVSALPSLLFTPVGGVLADRYNRRDLMVIFDFSSSSIILILSLLLRTGNATIPAIGVILVLLSIISSMYQPSVTASIPLLVQNEDLTSANGLVSGVSALSGLLGPIIGGMLYGVIGIFALVVIGCISFFFSAVMEIFIHIPSTTKTFGRNVLQDFGSDIMMGLRYVVQQQPLILRITLIAASLNALLSPFFSVGLPYILRITLNSNELLFGIGMSVLQLSSIVGALFAGKLTRNLTPPLLYKPLLIASLLMLPIAVAVTPWLLATGFWPPYILIIATVTALLAFTTGLSIFFITALQRVTPDDMLGKVTSFAMGVGSCAAPLGMALYGLLFEIHSQAVYLPTLYATAAMMVIALICKPALRGTSFETGVPGQVQLP